MPDLSIVFAVQSTVQETVSSPSVARKPTDGGGLSIFLGSRVIVVLHLFVRVSALPLSLGRRVSVCDFWLKVVGIVTSN